MEITVGRGTILAEKYRVESVLGRGGMGVVLKVTHLHLGEELAIKVLLPEGAIRSDVTARFLREAQAVVRLRGEHVARVIDVGVLPEGLPFIVMEYLHGADLSHDLKRRTNLSPGITVDYVLQACEALAEAHAHGIVHRDIKPANLFLTTRPDGTPLIKVLDFGISKAPAHDNNTLTQTEVVMGTPGYMSPEQMKATRDVDARTDIWALGIVLYECLMGRRPFDGESFSATVLMAGTEPPPPMNPQIPRGLQAVVLRCLQKDRRARFSTIAELVAALVPFARNQREAAMTAERTNLMLQRPIRPGDLAPPLAHDSISTTLSGSAASGLRPGHRRAIHGGIWLLGAVGVLSGAGIAIFTRVQAPVASAGGNPGSQDPSIASTAPSDARATERTENIKHDTSTMASDAGTGTSMIAQGSDASGNTSVVAQGSDAGLDAARVAVSAVPPGGDAGVALPTAHTLDAGSSIVPSPDSGTATIERHAPDPGSSDKKLPPSTPPPSSVPSHPPPRRPAPSPHSDIGNQMGLIVVSVKHAWAQVAIDGADAGTTPIRAPVTAGVHKVLLVYQGRREQLTVNVPGGGQSVIERNW
jgi:serine/threonine-protein kinase